VSNSVKRCQTVPLKKNTGEKTVQFGEIWCNPKQKRECASTPAKRLNKQENRKEIVKTNNKARKSSSKKIRVNPRNIVIPAKAGTRIKKIKVKNGEIWCNLAPSLYEKIL